MTVAVGTSFAFDNTYVRELEGLYEPWTAAPAPAPRLLALNEELAGELGLDAATLRSPDGVEILVGSSVPDGAQPVAQVYSGHQFGNYSPRLGDGRALLLGEVHDRAGHRRDLHLKGSGRTPFARGGDGKAPLGPMLREYVIGEAMHALGIPTTRALAVVATGEDVARDAMLPGAVLTRVASSHLRVGTFQYTAALGDPAQGDPAQGTTALLRRLADYAIARHHPDAAAAANPYLTFFERVLDTQASLVARWMLVGFVHGVMNTDNMTISGETIDYGPCAFLDAYDPATVFSSIDEAGRYAFGNQPRVAQWNLARLAEALLPLIDADQEAAVAAATEVLTSFPERYDRYWRDGMRTKLGVAGAPGPDEALIDDLPELLSAQRVDFTAFYRALSSAVRGDDAPMRSLLTDPSALDAWTARWKAVLATAGEPGAIADAMDRVNPVYIPRNQHVEEALTAATAGDMEPFVRLVDVLARPFDERAGLEAYAAPAPPEFGSYTTYCGT